MTKKINVGELEKEIKVEEIYRGDIYMVDFQEGEGASSHRGKRPCIIVSNNVGNKYSSVVNVVLLTTNLKKKQLPTHLRLVPDHRNKLRQESTVMCEQMRTIGKECLKFKIGTLSREDTYRLDYVLGKTLGLTIAKKSNKFIT